MPSKEEIKEGEEFKIIVEESRDFPFLSTYTASAYDERGGFIFCQTAFTIKGAKKKLMRKLKPIEVIYVKI